MGKQGETWAYCYPVIILDMLPLLWCRAIELSKQTAIVQMSLQTSRSTFWKDKNDKKTSVRYTVIQKTKKKTLFKKQIQFEEQKGERRLSSASKRK